MLDLNDRHGKIKELQEALRKIIKYNGGEENVFVNGIYDDSTVNAVKEFQRKNGMEVNGRTDYATWTAIFKASKNTERGRAGISIFDTVLCSSSVKKGDSGNCVRLIQIILDTLSTENQNLCPVVTDGIYGEKTEEAVKCFQRLSGLEESGSVDAETWDRMCMMCKNLLKKVQ